MVSVLVLWASSPGAAVEPPCDSHVLVLGAMPLELHPLLTAGTFDASQTVRVEDRTFWTGRLADVDVILAMTGIGLVNAEETAAAALDHYGCRIGSVVFSGVAGSRRSIGDVTIPQRWTLDGGTTWLPVDAAMLARAQRLRGSDVVALARDVPVGDDACLCPGVEGPSTPIRMDHQPQVFVGGDGQSSDTYGGKALPCVPGGGDVFGCQPCAAPGSTAEDLLEFAANAPSYADPTFLTDFLQPPAQNTDLFEAEDMESAAVLAVARQRGVPFLAIRSASDGHGDPLNLPGFPAQFFAYRHLAAQNAAVTTIEFLRVWAGGEGMTDPTPARPHAATRDREPGSLPASGGGVGAAAGLILGGVAGLRRQRGPLRSYSVAGDLEVSTAEGA